MITAVVKTIDKESEWDGGKGIIYYTTMTMDNDEKISIWKKKEHAFKVGDTVNYDHKDARADEYGIWKSSEVFPDKPMGWGTSGYQGRDYKKEAVSFAASYAKDIIIVSEKKDMASWEKIADKIYDWMIAKYDK